MVSMGCCCCCLENESAKLERAQKRAEENTDKMRTKVRAGLKMSTLNMSLKKNKSVRMLMANSPRSDETEADSLTALPPPDNLPEVPLGDQEEDWPTVKMWV